MGVKTTEFFNARGVHKVIRFLINEEFCDKHCDFLEDYYCTRFSVNIKHKGASEYLSRCEECLAFAKSCGGVPCKV